MLSERRHSNPAVPDFVLEIHPTVELSEQTVLTCARQCAERSTGGNQIILSAVQVWRFRFFAGETNAMRRPIQQQVLIPMLVVVLAGVAVASLAGAWMGARFARDQERDNLQRLAGTLVDAGFPLSENVLQKMAGLSGADFVVLSHDGQIQQATVRLSEQEATQLKQLDESSSSRSLPPDHTLSLAAGRYRATRLTMIAAPPRTEPQVLYVLYPEEHWDRLARRAAVPPLVAGLAAATIAVTLTTVLSRRFTTRVRLLSEQAAAIAGGRFLSTPLPQTDDELRDLTAALNRMSEQLGHYEEQIRRSERLRTLGQLGAGIAHQLRNSATGALMALELHAAELDPSADRESMDVALRQLHLMETSLRRFLQLGRGETAPRKTVDLRALIDETLPLVEPACRHANIRLAWSRPDAPTEIEGEADSLQQLLLNLLLNAIEAATDATGKTGDVKVELLCNPQGVQLRVLDSGPGPGADMATRVFEPFATSKPDGTGLGLSVAKEIAEAHSGTLSWRRENDLTCFELNFGR